MDFNLLKNLGSDDIFISYTRLDATKYAEGLRRKLKEKGFSCYIDRLGAPPDAGLPDWLKRKIRAARAAGVEAGAARAQAAEEKAKAEAARQEAGTAQSEADSAKAEASKQKRLAKIASDDAAEKTKLAATAARKAHAAEQLE